MELKDLSTAVISILLIGIVLGIGIYILSEVQTNVATEYTGEDSNINISNTAPANTTVLSDAPKTGYTLSSVNVVNGTGDTIPSTLYNYTDDGVITWDSTLVDNSSEYYSAPTADVNASSTYTYDAADSPEAGIGSTMNGLLDFAGWISVIVVVIAAAIVLGIVLRSFGEGAKV